MPNTPKPQPMALPIHHPATGQPDAQQLVEAFFAGRKPTTLRAYEADLRSFTSFVGVECINHAVGTLLGRGHGAANGLALAYKANLIEQGLAPATINRRLAALRSVVTLARTLGLVPWQLQIKNMKSETYRDTRGPGSQGFIRLLDVLDKRAGPKAVRDRAIVRLLFDLALRRGEVVSLDAEHLDLEAGTVAVLGKGRTARIKLTLPEPTKAVLADWLAVRGAEPGPLFSRLDRAGKGGRLTGRAVHKMVRKLGADAGLKTWPHALRHAAVTTALDVTNGDVRAVQRFSRHKSLNTVMIYDDNRADLGGEVARKVAVWRPTEPKNGVLTRRENPIEPIRLRAPGGL